MSLPAKRFQFSDSQNIVPTTNFYSVNDSNVLNGIMPGSNSLNNVSSLSGFLNTQAPGSNLISTGINDVSNILNTGTSAVGSVIGDALGLVTNVIGDTACLIGTVITDGASLVADAVGGVSTVVNSVFGGLSTDIPALKSLTSSCLGSLLNGGINLPAGSGLCNGLSNGCGPGITSIVSSLLSSCNGGLNSLTDSNNPIISQLQGNFLGNLSNGLLYNSGIGNLYSSVLNCGGASGMFSGGSLLSAGANILSGYTGQTTSPIFSDFSNIDSGSLGMISGVSNLALNAISNITNNYVGGSSNLLNISGGSLVNASVTGANVIDSFNNIRPNWNTSPIDGSNSISSMTSNNSSNDLANTAVYGLLQTNVASNGISTGTLYNPTASSLSSVNSTFGSDTTTNTYMGMSSGSNNGLAQLESSLSPVSGYF